MNELSRQLLKVTWPIARPFLILWASIGFIALLAHKANPDAVSFALILGAGASYIFIGIIAQILVNYFKLKKRLKRAETNEQNRNTPE